MNTFNSPRGLLKTTVLALVAVAMLSGCSENPVSPVEPAGIGSRLEPKASLPPADMFNGVQTRAIGRLSLSEVTLLTPFFIGSSTFETATLSELTKITPALTNFHTAFNTEMSVLSVGDASKVVKYMVAKKLISPLYPIPEDGRGSKEQVPA